MRINTLAAMLFAMALLPGLATADELTQVIQQDLAALGYDPGNTDGEASTKTVVAISKFQAENGLEVTGVASPQLAGVIKAAIRQQNSPTATRQPRSTAAPPPQQDPAALEAARQACLQEKIAAAQAASKTKRGFGSLIRAATRTASRFAGGDTARAISSTARDIYDVNATAEDLSSAAKDLGLTEDEIEQCRNPQR
ncbi:peptidoglycan-binding protein [Thioalkalivibrio sp. XN8]|uniref:peptidoglycan-binding domain-containing protein n=1 Tax=Thioalkalivibrio sp. XN8 TaxID=2712863 RepID=UPI0013EA54E5|nr:peptidoglycan-binding protein [Thioalkalivibrio sp. XN8]NGP54444.1 peptidoglycan-binding protein [Thioalkalivibrio sp. XN8]